MPAPSQRDLFEQTRAAFLVQRPDLVALPGDTSYFLSTAAVAAGDLILGSFGQRVAETYLDGAQGDALTALVRDHWGIDRVLAVSSRGQVTLSHVAGPTGTIPAGSRVATQPDASGAFQTYLTDVDLVWGAGDNSLSVAATAKDGGMAGNAAAGTVTRVLDSLFDTFTVTNASRFAGGAPAQTDPELREAARGFQRTVEKGTLAALEFGATQIPARTVKIATAVEDPSGITYLYVADGQGNSNSTMVDAVTAILPNWRAAGSLVQVVGGVLYTQAISVSLVVKAGVSIPALAARVRTAIAAAVNRLPIGATLYTSLIQAAARAVDPTNIIEVIVNNPGASVAPDAGQVIRTSTGIITVGG